MTTSFRDRPTVIERAYQLARSGQCGGIGDVRSRLMSEGYLDTLPQLAGAGLKRELSRLCREAQGKTAPLPPIRRRSGATHSL
jgi:hypothetical protein